MPSTLYDILGIAPNATPEDVRKAYKKKALETHPDRLPQGASAAEKATSEDLFRKVNNAYEVLSDSQNRATYDEHGVWPPPATPQGPFTNGPTTHPSNPFFNPTPFSRDPFYRDPFPSFGGGFGFGARPNAPRGFTDPFVLFNSIFGDLARTFEGDPFFDAQFGRRGVEPASGFFNRGFPPAPSPFDLGGRRSSWSNTGGGNGGRWVSESWTSSTVNGVTHTKCVRKDSEGNEHVSYRLPDGTERRTINGIEQSGAAQPPRALPGPPPAVGYPTRSATLPPYYDAVGGHRSRPSRHHTHYEDYPADARHEHRDERHSSWYRDDGQRHHPFRS